MEQKINEIEINGITYVKKDESQQMAPQRAGMDYCMVRTEAAGVFAGYVESRSGQEVVLRTARRIWFWTGAASLSQLAVDGTADPAGCKFHVAVDKVILLNAIEIIPITERAKKSIEAVPVWTSKLGSGYGDG